jgi:hypothetical protein
MINKRIPDWDKPESESPVLIHEFTEVLKRNRVGIALCVPEFALAEMLVKNLCAFANLNKQTETWSKE